MIRARSAAAAVMVFLLIVGCEARSEKASEIKDPVASARETDKLAAEELAKSKIDAKQWLASEKHGTFEATKSDILKLTNDCLAAGAVGVYVSGPEQADDKELVSTLFIELPADADKRAKLLALYNKVTEADQDPEKDVGQKFLVYDWD
jgi:hypothetical protein